MARPTRRIQDIDNLDTLRAYFIKEWKKSRKHPDFALLSDKEEVLQAYNNMITRSYEPIEY